MSTEQYLTPPEKTINKFYLIKYPCGNVSFVTDLNDFAKSHDLSKQCLLLVADGKRKQHKGYTVLKYAIPFHFFNSHSNKAMQKKAKLMVKNDGLVFEGEIM